MTAERELPGVRRLHPARVLLVGDDRRFLRVASLLLERHGCGVQCIRRAEDLVDRIGRHAANVVVIDASPSLTVAARSMAAVEALSPSVRVVLVYDGDGTPLEHLRLVPKWGAFSQILAEVEAGRPATAAEGIDGAHG